MLLNERLSYEQETLIHLLFIQASHERAKQLLESHRKELVLLAKALMKYETLDKSDIEALLKGGNLKDLKKKKEEK